MDAQHIERIETIFSGKNGDSMDFYLELVCNYYPRKHSQHSQVAFEYFNRNHSLDEVRGLMDSNVSTIKTPRSLIGQRFISKTPIPRRRVHPKEFGSIWYVFQDPGFFYYYGNVGLIFSPVPVHCHKMIPNGYPVYMGKRWAVFEETAEFGGRATFTFRKLSPETDYN